VGELGGTRAQFAAGHAHTAKQITHGTTIRAQQVITSSTSVNKERGPLGRVTVFQIDNG